LVTDPATRHSDRVPVPTLDEPADARRITPYRVVAVLLLVGMVALWAYVLTRTASPPPDKLDDATFAPKAQQVCDATMVRVDQLPQAFQSESAADRADVVDQIDADLATMLDTLRAEVPAAERDSRMLTEWLDDWETYLGNRVDYVQRLRDDPDARIYVAEKDGRQITVAIDRFAEVNDMPDCRTPKDVS
jgi:hypothetical protein